MLALIVFWLLPFLSGIAKRLLPSNAAERGRRGELRQRVLNLLQRVRRVQSVFLLHCLKHDVLSRRRRAQERRRVDLVGRRRSGDELVRGRLIRHRVADVVGHLLQVAETALRIAARSTHSGDDVRRLETGHWLTAQETRGLAEHLLLTERVGLERRGELRGRELLVKELVLRLEGLLALVRA